MFQSPTYNSISKLEKSWQAHFDGHPIVGPVLNKILLHPSGETFVTTGTDGRIRLWDLGTYECVREIKPFEHSTLPHTISWYGNTLLCAGKDGSPKNTCGDFVRAIAWDLTRLLLEDGVMENCSELVPPRNFIHSLWLADSRVVISARRKGMGVIEVWSEEDETA
jgi:WD domain, G-beta repeat